MRIVSCLIFVLTAGCTHSIHQLYVSSQDPAAAGKNKWVTADASDLVVLGFQMNTNYVEEAYHELEKKCRGRVAQVTSEHLTSFKLLSYEQKIVLKGFCLGS